MAGGPAAVAYRPSLQAFEEQLLPAGNFAALARRAAEMSLAPNFWQAMLAEAATQGDLSWDDVASTLLSHLRRAADWQGVHRASGRGVHSFCVVTGLPARMAQRSGTTPLVCRPMFARVSRNSPNIRQVWSKLCQLWTTSGQIRLKSLQLWSNPDQIWSKQVCCVQMSNDAG